MSMVIVLNDWSAVRVTVGEGEEEVLYLGYDRDGGGGCEDPTYLSRIHVRFKTRPSYRDMNFSLHIDLNLFQKIVKNHIAQSEADDISKESILYPSI